MLRLRHVRITVITKRQPRAYSELFIDPEMISNYSDTQNGSICNFADNDSNLLFFFKSHKFTSCNSTATQNHISKKACELNCSLNC